VSKFVVDHEFADAVAAIRWHLNSVGYMSGKDARGRTISLHRYVWSLAHGGDLPRMLDHINGDKLDCRITNLRQATGSLNCRSRLRSSGGRFPEGVQAKPNGKPYFTHICLWRQTLYLGSFDSIGDASQCYERARDIIMRAEAIRATQWRGQPVPPPARSSEKSGWNLGWRRILTAMPVHEAVSAAVEFAEAFVPGEQEEAIA
jgi:hypothetical protein